MLETRTDAILDARAIRLARKRDRYLAAGQWALIWRRFRRHTLGLIGGGVAVLIYLIAIFAEFLAPTTLEDYTAAYRFAPPTAARDRPRRRGWQLAMGPPHSSARPHRRQGEDAPHARARPRHRRAGAASSSPASRTSSGASGPPTSTSSAPATRRSR